MKTVFPAIYSTLSPEALSFYISEKYALKNVWCKLLVRGVGDTYLAETPDNRFILRVYRSSHRNLQQIKEEVALLQLLKETAVSVSWPVPDVSGETIQVLEAVEGERCAVLFSYAPGHAVRLPDEIQLQLLGSEMARFHQVSSSMARETARWEFNTDTMFIRPLEMFRAGFASIPEDYAWLQQAAEAAVKKLSAAEGLSMGYCHFDLLPKNMHFENDTITLFDFDFMGYGWLVNDIACYWQHLALEVYTKRMTQQVADEQYNILLDAYRTHRALSQEELEVVPYLAVGWWFFYMGFHTSHDQFHAYTQPGQLKLFTGLLKHLATYWT